MRTQEVKISVGLCRFGPDVPTWGAMAARRATDIARAVIGQKSVETIVAASLLTRKVQRRAEHEEKRGRWQTLSQR